MNSIDEYNEILPKDRMQATLSTGPTDYKNAVP